MKLLLILPSQLDHDGNPIRRKKAALNLNLNLMLLAGLTPKDVEVQVINDYVTEVDPDIPCDLVGITTTIATAYRAYQLAKQFRDRGKTVVLGGFHASIMPEEASQHCDALVIGEADETWPELIDDFRHGTLKPVYQKDTLPDLSRLPTPRYDLAQPHKYRVEVFPVETSRGCPMACDYCCVTRFHGFQHRLRPIGDIIRDIKATGSRFIGFADDNMIGHKEHARELFKAMIPLNIRWMGQSTMYMADDEELLNLALQSGMRLCWIGIESIRASNLEEVHRKINQINEFERRIKAFRDRGVLVATNMMFGFDDESEEHYEQTYQFLIRNRVFPFLWMMIPVPGSALYERYDNAGRLLHKDWSRYSAYEVVFKPKNFTPEKLEDLFWELGQRLFSVRNNFMRSFPLIRKNNLKEDFFIRLGEFAIGNAVGRAAKQRWPTTW